MRVGGALLVGVSATVGITANVGAARIGAGVRVATVTIVGVFAAWLHDKRSSAIRTGAASLPIQPSNPFKYAPNLTTEEKFPIIITSHPIQVSLMNSRGHK